MSEKKKILLVEDNAETQLIIKVNIRDLYDVEVTDNAKEALSLLSHNNFNLVLLDINLGGEQDGKSVLNKLRGEMNRSDLPVIIITAYDLPEEDKIYLKNLSCDYLEKPLDKNILIKSIGKCFRTVKQ